MVGWRAVLRRWWAQWCAYTRYKQPPASETADGSSEAIGSTSTATATGPEVPESIDNLEIVYAGEKLRENLEENKDFVIVSYLMSTKQPFPHAAAGQSRLLFLPARLVASPLFAMHSTVQQGC